MFQALKKQLKKRALVIQKVLTKRMDKLKSRMNQLELENKELQQLACNLRGALADVIQQQKQVGTLWRGVEMYLAKM